jgi:hypothetical protein
MTKQEQRVEIRSITRGELRHMGYEPTETDADTIVRVLDGMAWTPGKVADWYMQASDNQVKTLVREIRKGVR